MMLRLQFNNRVALSSCNRRVIPIVSSSGISDFHSEAMVKGPGVVTGRYGTIGEVFYIDGDFWPLNTTLYVCDFKGSDPRFISYFLRTLDFQAYSDKGAVPGVNRNHLHTAKVRIPALPVQKAIARILDALDSKIDLNHRINQTLEAMAQAIFKSWFIDFDPVKARIAAIEQGQDPLRAAMRAISGKTDAELDQMPREHHDQLAATAALFSDAMEESELWEIPKGWGIKSVSNIARFATGKIEVSSLTVENYISTENMLENRGGISHASSLPAVATVPTFESGNVLVSNIRPYFKKIWLARFDGGRSNDVLCFEAKEDGCQEFLYNLLYQDIFFEFMMRTSKGAKMPRGDKEAIAGWKFPCAPLELRKAFSKKVRTFYSYIESINLESKQLSELRDTLLPKLLSGDLSVADLK
ncbi:restriction endonuclease subunit S [Pseudomonas aeruginosa]|uniref:restriction endonuclease subunit S n=1 Tax=Pseudomonas aeruginosa TaxID=287 RepID=UPI0022CE1759|nr:restriction endonuclease subunit S [Pseudomonas aeruginosa]MCZ9766009.1 restriction endonuclease subunit S [Pseudomonas aeruginosa]